MNKYVYSWEEGNTPKPTEEQRAAYIIADLLASTIMKADQEKRSLYCWENDAFNWLSQQWKRDPWKMNLWTHDRMKQWEVETSFI
jgi:hypothetical protein